MLWQSKKTFRIFEGANVGISLVCVSVEMKCSNPYSDSDLCTLHSAFKTDKYMKNPFLQVIR